MQVIIAGSRHLNDFRFISRAIEKSPFKDKITEVVSGGCYGIDKLGEKWARQNNVPIKVFYADWEQHGKSAGPIRNQYMLSYVGQFGGLIAIPHPTEKSSGTWCIVGKARSNGQSFFVYKIEEDFVFSNNVWLPKCDTV